MIRGTTPTETYTLENPGVVDLDQCVEIWVTFHDHVGHDFTWDIDRLTLDEENHEITLTLTQEETLALAVGKCQVQIRFLYNTGAAFATEPAYFEVENVRKDGVIYVD